MSQTASPIPHDAHALLEEYEGKTAAYYEAARPDMRALVPANVTRLLDVGCGGGAFGAQLKIERANMHVTGLELTSWADVARDVLDNVLRADVERDDLADVGMFDCVSFNDVLEHLTDPWQALRRVKEQLEPGGYVIASSPNMRFYQVLKELVLSKRFTYAESGVMDRTHLRWWTSSSFPEMFRSVGFTVLKTGGHGGDGALPFKFSMLNAICLGAFDDTRFPQLYCVAQKPN